MQLARDGGDGGVAQGCCCKGESVRCHWSYRQMMPSATSREHVG